MKLLLVQPLDYLFFAGGAHKANRILMEGLAARGHGCRVITPAPNHGSESRRHLLSLLAERRIEPLRVDTNMVTWRHRGVTVHTASDAFEIPQHILDAVREETPDWVIVSEDLSGHMLRTALECLPGRVVYLAHSQTTMPFGPESFYQDETKTALLGRCAGIITVSHYLRDYIWRHGGGLDATVLRFPAYGSGPFPSLRNFDRGRVLMINPSAIKGVSIFIALAKRFSHVPFAAIPSWATTEEERAQLAALPNVRLLPPRENVDEIYAEVRVLVVPSLWGESFGQVIVEAMLRGVPVMASHVGGIPEAKLGVDYLLPINKIERYAATLGGNGFPEPIIPEQNVGPWVTALDELLGNRSRYEQVSAESYRAANEFVSRLDLGPFEAFLRESLQPEVRPCQPVPPPAPPRIDAGEG